MRSSEIDDLCRETAQSTGLPVDWIQHHVTKMAGKPCHRCGGAGIDGRGACSWCRGSGGRASHVGVGNALEWVRQHVEQVRQLGTRRQRRLRERSAAEEIESSFEIQLWKLEHSDVWVFLSDMLDSDFKRSVVQAIEDGTVTDNQVNAVRKAIETQRRRDAVAPSPQSMVHIAGRIVHAAYTYDSRGRKVLRVEFDTEPGWRGRLDIEDDVKIAETLRRPTDDVDVRGRVEWSKAGFAIFTASTEFRPKRNNVL